MEEEEMIKRLYKKIIDCFNLNKDIAAVIPKKLLMDKGWKFDENIVVVVTESEILLRKKDAFLKEKYKNDIEIFEEVLDNLKSKSTIPAKSPVKERLDALKVGEVVWIDGTRYECLQKLPNGESITKATGIHTEFI